jgi:ABC-type cobalamin/Fe3+-siderophores transport system ATPase subunit
VAALLVEQNAHMALSIGDRGYVLETGRLVAEGNPKALWNNDGLRAAYRRPENGKVRDNQSRCQCHRLAGIKNHRLRLTLGIPKEHLKPAGVI